MSLVHNVVRGLETQLSGYVRQTIMTCAVRCILSGETRNIIATIPPSHPPRSIVSGLGWNNWEEHPGLLEMRDHAVYCSLRHFRFKPSVISNHRRVEFRGFVHR